MRNPTNTPGSIEVSKLTPRTRSGKPAMSIRSPRESIANPPHLAGPHLAAKRRKKKVDLRQACACALDFVAPAFRPAAVNAASSPGHPSPTRLWPSSPALPPSLRARRPAFGRHREERLSRRRTSLRLLRRAQDSPRHDRYLAVILSAAKDLSSISPCAKPSARAPNLQTTEGLKVLSSLHPQAPPELLLDPPTKVTLSGSGPRINT
jgi:hypothetical protein